MCRTPHRTGRRLTVARLVVPTGMWLALVAGGCSSFRETEKTHYETVQADAQHDTPLAEADHAKAIEYISGRSCAGGCDLVKAEEYLEKALVADVTYGPAHNTLGMLYLRQHRPYLAAWEFEYANKLMPERFEPIYNLALVYESADKLDRAIEFASMAFSMAPRNPDVLETLIRTRMRNGESVDEVRPLIKEVLFYETRPAWVCWAKDQLGRAPENTGRKPSLPPSGPGQVPPPPEPLLRQGAEPPAPTDAPAPKIARPILPDRATSSMGPVRNDLFLEVGQSDVPPTTKSDTPPYQPLLITGRSSPATRQSNPSDSSQSDVSQSVGSDANSESGPRFSPEDSSGHAKIAPDIPTTP